ncbi:hypothetical protein MLD38_007143 [Melastoma candidum]|uniref:Uncharacterized protein n=1 Tax=Melastoma candidum TaxID=119954 RepID=A0ACB9RQ50_9MYRT|nr:hypothetical protein MLD38_007143 [Melastoma candidum]
MDDSDSAPVSPKDEGDPPPANLCSPAEDDDDDDGVDIVPSKPSPSSPPSPSPSPSSPSPSPSPPTAVPSNGRISVCLPSQMEHNRSPPSPVREPAPLQVLALAVPSQSSFPGGPNFSSGGGVGGREDFWTESATEVLIDAWAERYVGLSKGSLKQNNWKEVAEIVNGAEDRSKTPRSDMQCKNRIDTVKKKYKNEKARVVAGGGPSRWKFFEKMDRLLGHLDPNPVAPAPRTKSGKGLDKAWTAVKGPRSKPKSKKRGWASGWESDGDGNDNDEVDDEAEDLNMLPPLPPSLHGKILGRKAKGTNGRQNGLIGGDALLELTKAIESFGEVYEKTERAKLREVVEMEKQRMKFAKEMEVQRMQFFMKTQVEIAKHGRKKSRRSDHSGNRNATEDRKGGGDAD